MEISKVSKAKVGLVIGSPFWGVLAMNTEFIETEAPPPGLPAGWAWTAATDGVRVYLNPCFLAKLSHKQVMLLLAHELGHIMFGHSFRMGARDPETWNAAGDYVINHLLMDDKTLGLEFIEGGLLDARYTTNTETVYALLLEESGGEKKPGGPGGVGYDIIPNRGTDAEKAEQLQKVQQIVAQAATAARLAGKMSGALERLVDGVLHKDPHWTDALLQYMQRVARDDESWSRLNRRVPGVILPGRYSVRLGPICMIVDTSGSISSDELRDATARVHQVADLLQPESIRAIAADIGVTSETLIEDGDEVTFTLRGGGGTDMRVPLEYVEQYEPCVVVLITDGETPWPDLEPPYPLIVCCTTNADVPVGSVIRLR